MYCSDIEFFLLENEAVYNDPISPVRDRPA